MLTEGEHKYRVQKVLLYLNKTGLSYLKYSKFTYAAEFFKKAYRIIEEYLSLGEYNQKIYQLAGITFNNLACYYKKTRKPKVALGYLKKSLELEVFKLNDWVSTGSTHLNICAIYSYLDRHQDALNHVELALGLLNKASFEKDNNSDEAKAYWNIKMLGYYNKAVEEEHLKSYEMALESYKQAKEVAKISKSKNEGIIAWCDYSIVRLEQLLSNLQKRMISLSMKKREYYEAGHCEFMRRNKQHSAAHRMSFQEIPSDLSRKFSHYKTAAKRLPKLLMDRSDIDAPSRVVYSTQKQVTEPADIHQEA